MPLRFYPGLIFHQPERDFGVMFPDLPGCISTGETAQEAATNATEALSLHLEGMVADKGTIPEPSPPDAPLPDWLAHLGDEIVATVMVPVETPGKTVRANITLDEALLARLDSAAADAGMSRSGYIAEAVRSRLRT